MTGKAELDKDCIFCKIIRGEIPSIKLHEDAEILAFMDINPIARAIEKTLDPDGLNIVQANGPGAKQSVFHLHIHVVPRAINDGLTMNWDLVPGDKDEIAKMAKRIRANVR